MAKHGKLRNYLEYVPVKLALMGLGRLPPRTAYRIGQSISKIAYQLAGDLRRTGTINLRLAFPEKTEEERDALLHECFESLGRQLGLFSQMATRSREEIRQLIHPVGWDNLENARAERGDRLIYVTGHLGAWEMTSFGISLLGYPLTFLTRRLDNPKIEELVDGVRTKFGNRTIDKLSAARAMVKLLRSGEHALGLLPDLNTLDDEAIFVDFFGVPAATTLIIAKLAVRTNTPLVPFFAPWSEEKGKYLLIAEPPIMAECTGDEEADVRRVTIEITRRVENQIRQFPGQWLWIHKRWKTRPPGEPKIY
jgi:Kdo2-lipid IVA lauroyltransferase/acyltransferase